MPRRLTTDHLFAAASFIVGFLTYWSSVAPTTSFWDCGEFIACSYTLGVPHPPGSPLFILLGRIMTMLPIAKDIGLRVNMISVLFSSFSLLFTYLAIARLIRMYRGVDKSWEDSFIVGAGAFIGTLALSFSYSFWFNSVEAEVYAAATFFTAIPIWLILKWQDYSDQPKGDKILILIAYTLGLATGVHLLNLLAIWTLFQIVYFHKFKFSWQGFLIANGIGIIVFFIIYPGIIKYIPSSANNISLWIPLAIIAGLILILRWAHKNRKRLISLSLLSILLIILGYSTYGLLFVRSKLGPSIDENNPDNLPRLVYYLNREQYGDAPIFNRRWNGDPKYKSKWDFFWRYQVHHMYTRYFLWQFVGMEGDFQGANVDFSKYYTLPLLLGFLGMALHFQRDSKRAFSILTLFFMAGYGIILYLNQEDPQPRERDYSYVGSFYAFAIWIGIGASYLIELARHVLRNAPEYRKIGIYGSSAIILALIPGNMLLKNYDVCKRTGEYVAWDYSHNILQSCAPDAVIFTNGDNDTFPLWYLQEVEGIRKDVRVVNLSLLNTGWYIKQLRDQEPKVPISLSDDFIDNYIDGHDWQALRFRYWPEGKKTVSIASPEGNYEWELPATMHIAVSAEDTGQKNFLRVQDVMILNIISTTQGKKPIYFAVTVSNENMIGLRSYLTMEGLAFRLRPVKGELIDPVQMRKSMMERFEGHYRNLNNPKVHFNDNIVKLLQNYRSGFLQLAYYYYQRNEPGKEPGRNTPLSEQYAEFDSLSSKAKVNLILRWMEKDIPEKVIPINNDEITLQIGRMYFDCGYPEELEKRIDELAGKTRDWQKKLSYAAMLYQWLRNESKATMILEKTLNEVKDNDEARVNIASLMGRMNKTELALKILDEVLTHRPNNEIMLNIASAYYSMRQDTLALKLYEELVAKNSNDGQAMGGLLSVYERLGEYQKALEMVEKWLQLHPQDTQAQKQKELYQRMVSGGTKATPLFPQIGIKPAGIRPLKKSPLK